MIRAGIAAAAYLVAAVAAPAQFPDPGPPPASSPAVVSHNDYPASPRITPLRPVTELRKEALLDHPPEEKGNFRKPDLVELRDLDPSIHYDIRYATANNFLGTPVYSEAHAKLQRPAAEALVQASAKLRPRGFGLLIHDAYRPWFVTKIFWDATPPDKREFVANPAEGSRHNRGCAVDLTLYDLASGEPVDMPGGYDEMSKRSYPSYTGGTPIERWHRDVLRWAMESDGFEVYPTEWWHFDYKDWKEYPILNITLEERTSYGRIYLYAQRSTAAHSWLTIACDDIVLASIKRGFYFAFDVPPGHHMLSVEHGVPAPIDIHSGVDSYVRLDWVMEVGRPPVPVLGTVAPPAARSEMRFLSYIDRRRIAADSVLRTDPRPQETKELLTRDSAP